MARSHPDTLSGTLTQGAPSVTQTRIFDDSTSLRRFYQLTGSAESASEHPLAKAILEKAKVMVSGGLNESERLQLVEPEQFSVEPGRGLRCRVKSQEVMIGNRSWMEDNRINVWLGGGWVCLIVLLIPSSFRGDVPT